VPDFSDESVFPDFYGRLGFFVPEIAFSGDESSEQQVLHTLRSSRLPSRAESSRAFSRALDFMGST
jgi:hypothetical protein